MLLVFVCFIILVFLYIIGLNDELGLDIALDIDFDFDFTFALVLVFVFVVLVPSFI